MSEDSPSDRATDLNWLGKQERKLSEYSQEHLWYRRFLRLGVLLAPAVAAIAGLVNLEARPKGIVLGVAALITLGITVLGVLTANGTAEVVKSAKRSWQEGYYEGITHWRRQAGIRAGALRQVFRHLNSIMISLDQGLGRPSSVTTRGVIRGDDAVQAFLIGIANLVAIYFDLDATTVNANLMVPTKKSRKPRARTELWLVQFAKENHDRSPNRTVVKVAPKSPSPGAARAYCTGQPSYVFDTRDVKEIDPSRPYKSIISWPIVCDSASDVLGVVNIDATRVGAFGALDDNGDSFRLGAIELGSDALLGIGIALLDPKCYPCNGKRV